MIVIIIAALLLLGIAFFQAVQGMFSAIIMAVLSVLCAAIALNFYEPLAAVLIAKGWLGGYAHGLVLLALFVIPLLVLREIFDRVIRRSVQMGVWPDRIGGGALGLLTGLVLVGMLMIVVALLPLGGSFISYRPYDAQLQVDQGSVPRLAARFTLGLAKCMSAGAIAPIGGGDSFAEAHDDWLLDAFCGRSRPGGGKTSALPESRRVGSVCRLRGHGRRRRVGWVADR